jgi:predicted HAD superfamily hydrolase
MKVLYVIDPFLSVLQPGAVFGTYRHHVANLHRMLRPYIEEGKVDFMLLVEERLQLKGARKNLGSEVPTATLRLQSFADDATAPAEAMKRWVEGKISQSEIDTFREEVLSALGSFGVPDIVIASESPATPMRLAFPNCVVLSESWGIFSRQPFPLIVGYDPCGLYGSSAIARYADDIKAFSLDNLGRSAIDKLRSRMALALAEHDPVGSIIEKLRPEYKKLLLFPLQTDGQYGLLHATGLERYSDAVERVLETIPASIGLLVTLDPERCEPLDADEIAALQRRFPNLLHVPALDRVPMAASFALPYIDGVVTVSSNLAFQAALFRIPVFTIGHSHTAIVSCGGIDAAAETLSASPLIDRDNVLYWVLTHHNVFLEAEQLVAPNFLAMLEHHLKNRELTGFARFSTPRLSADQLNDFFDRYELSGALGHILGSAGIAHAPDHVLVAIARTKAVSFDLFDTLVTRPFIEPHFLFYALEQRIRKLLGNTNFRFMYWRRLAEEETRREHGGCEVTLEAIYLQFAKLTGLSLEQCAAIADQEFAAELTMISPREVYVRAMTWARRLGRVTSIITDIYLDERQIREILTAVGIVGFDHLYVSGEIEIRKHDGTVYPQYLADLYNEHRITPRDGVAHIGDNHHADGEMARRHGLQAVVVPRAIDRLRSSAFEELFASNFHKRHAISDYLVGLIANRFDAAIAAPGSRDLFAGSWFNVGYAAAGPMLLAYVQWVIRKARAAGLTKVYFVARDGYILKEIYDRIREAGIYTDLPESGYVYLSRRATAVAALKTRQDIAELLHLPFATRRLDDLLENRFGLPPDLISKKVLRKCGFKATTRVSDSADLARLQRLLDSLAPVILKNSADERAALVRYLDDNGVIAAGSNCALVDIGYSGSIQRYVQNILGINIPGYYMLTHEPARWTFEGSSAEAFFAEWDEPRMADCHPLNEYVFLFETVLSSCEASLKRHRYDENGVWSMEHLSADREPQRFSFMKRIHAGIVAFADDFIVGADFCFDDLPLGTYLGSKVFFELARRPRAGDARLFAGLKVENSFGGGNTWLLYDEPAAASSITPRTRDVALGKSQWKEAAQVLYAAPQPPQPAPAAMPKSPPSAPPAAPKPPQLVPSAAPKATQPASLAPPKPPQAPARGPQNGKAPLPEPVAARPPLPAPPATSPKAPPAALAAPPVTEAKAPPPAAPPKTLPATVAVVPTLGPPVVEVMPPPRLPVGNGHDSIPAQLKGIEVPPAIRKYAKFRRDPYNFCADSKNPLVRAARVFYREFQ